MKLYNQVINRISDARKFMVVYTVDGLTNVRHESVFNLMACTPIPHFLESFSLESSQESSENLFKIITSFISKLDETQPLQITQDSCWSPLKGICTDNPNVMLKLRQLLAEREGWIVYGCSCHALNLLTSDLMRKKLFKRTLKYNSL